MDKMDKLRAAFPEADEIVTDARDYGFRTGFGLRYGTRRHAISLHNGRTLDEAIAKLKSWGAR